MTCVNIELTIDNVGERSVGSYFTRLSTITDFTPGTMLLMWHESECSNKSQCPDPTLYWSHTATSRYVDRWSDTTPVHCACWHCGRAVCCSTHWFLHLFPSHLWSHLPVCSPCPAAGRRGNRLSVPSALPQDRRRRETWWSKSVGRDCLRNIWSMEPPICVLVWYVIHPSWAAGQSFHPVMLSQSLSITLTYLGSRYTCQDYSGEQPLYRNSEVCEYCTSQTKSWIVHIISR